MTKKEKEKSRKHFFPEHKIARSPLSYSIKHRFGQRSQKGYGREFAANVFERVAAVVKIIIDNQPSVVRRRGPNVSINRFNIGGRVVDIAQRGQVFARINVGGNARCRR